MKWSKPRKEKSPTQQALLDLAAKCRKLRMQGQHIPHEIETQYRELLAQNYKEKA
jgi:hypothetical protein